MSYIPLRLPPGVDLRRSLEEITFAGGSRSGFVVAGIGSLSSPRIRFAGESAESTVAGAVELLSIAGSLSADGAHLHVTVADGQGRVFGGHLCHGSIVRTTAELLLAPTENFLLSRAADPASGYRELVVQRLPQRAGELPAIERARPTDAAECVLMRGRTRENAISAERLRAAGITAQSWAADIESDVLPGWIARDEGRLVGYGFGARDTGEVVVLAVLPEYEGAGLGRELLLRVVSDLRAQGHESLHLRCNADPQGRSYGFYRHLGWRGTGQLDAHGDEFLILDLDSSTQSPRRLPEAR